MQLIVIFEAIILFLVVIYFLVDSILKLRPLCIIFFALVLILFSAPSLSSLLLSTFWDLTRVPVEHAVIVYFYCFLCLSFFIVGNNWRDKVTNSANPPKRNPEKSDINEWWYIIWFFWLVGLLGIGATPEGFIHLWNQSWLVNASISENDTIGLPGYIGYVCSAMTVVGGLSITWAHNKKQIFLLIIPLILSILFAIAGGGRTILAPIILGFLFRMRLFYRNKSRYLNIFLKNKFVIGLTILLGLILVTTFFNFIYFLRDYRYQDDLISVVSRSQTYEKFKDYLINPDNTPLGDVVWTYAFQVTFLSPKYIPIQPLRILSDIISYSIPGFVYNFFRGPTIENDLAQFFWHGTYAGATIHPSFIGISYLLLGWFGFLLFFPIGKVTNFFDDKLQDTHNIIISNDWLGFAFIFGYFLIFFLRGAVIFAFFRSIYALYFWITFCLIRKLSKKSRKIKRNLENENFSSNYN
jgi:hypothetical protein